MRAPSGRKWNGASAWVPLCVPIVTAPTLTDEPASMRHVSR